MDGQNSISADLIFIMVTLGMILLSLGMIIFVFVYQRKMQGKKLAFQKLEVAYQKEMLNAMIETKELEQRRIAVELHDEVGSSLTALKFELLSLPLSTEEKEKISINLVNAIQNVRRISNELMPSILEELGLITASNSLIKQLSEQIRMIEFRFQAVNDPSDQSQTREVNLAFYRVLQELINNIIKYAEATSVDVFLNQNENGLELTITDNGKGFNPNELIIKDSPSLGLKNIASRLQQIGGKIHYKKLTKGTKVTVTWKAKNVSLN